MKSGILVLVVLVWCAAGDPAFAQAFKAPDSIVLKDGRTVHGLIIKNSVDSVLMQEEFGEQAYPKSEIVRICDEADIGVLCTDIARKGSLPPWRVIANDLRTHDQIRSLVEIPATMIASGVFKNVPYLSFRANDDVELDIYGDPNDPAGIEIGIFGKRRSNVKLQRALRGYLAGFLTTRKEIAALYGIDLREGKKTAGDITFETTPPTAEDAYGAWWISIYNMKKLDAIRLSDAEYAKLTRPAEEVVGRNGLVLSSARLGPESEEGGRVRLLRGDASRVIRGFYRDANGHFQLLTKPSG